MKKGVITLTLAVLLAGGIVMFNGQEIAAKTNLKTQVQKNITGQKVGKTTYYLNKKDLMSVKSGKKAKKLVKNICSYKVSGKYVYYVSDSLKLYRMKKNGAKKIKLTSGCKSIQMIHGKYICFEGNSGCFTIKNNGKKKTKIFQYDTKPIYMNGRYYATQKVDKTDKNAAYCVLQSVKTTGTGKKDEYKFENANETEAFKVNGKVAVVTHYTGKSVSIWQKNDVGIYEEKKIGAEEYIIGKVEYTGGKWIACATERTEENKDSDYLDVTQKDVCLYEVKEDGTFELFMDLNKMSVAYSQGYNGLKQEGNFYTMESSDRTEVYVIDKNSKKVIYTIKQIKSWGDDSEYFSYKIKKNVISYQCFNGTKTHFLYRIFKL